MLKEERKAKRNRERRMQCRRGNDREEEKEEGRVIDVLLADKDTE
jgi:hypothetical protein